MWDVAPLDLWPCAFVFWEDGFRLVQQPLVGSKMFPEMESLGKPKPQLRVTRRYPSRSFPYFIAPNKSVGESSVVAQCTYSGPNAAVEQFNLGGRHLVELYADCASVQLRGREDRRVVSLLLPSRPSGEHPDFDAATLPLLAE